MEGKLTVDSLTYLLEDQALMARAENYFAWQARLILPELGQRVLEVGCGSGNFTRTLLGREAVIAVDNEPACVERLVKRFPGQANLYTAVCGPDEDAFEELARFRPDSLVCLNVLEHIKDDAAAVRRMAAILPAGSAMVLLLPAFPALHGSIDRNLGHFRRYSGASVKRLAAHTGLTVERVEYMNLMGFFGWWLNARIFRRQAQSAWQIALFDKSIAPAMSRIESRFPPPFGQSLLAVLRKP
jgi:SAM-dependent methyltransferase